MNRLQSTALAGAFIVLTWPAAMASAEEAFAGKTVSLLVSSDVGGGFDAYTRLLAPYMQKYLPGAPTILVQNMPGGGGLRLTQHLYRVAEKDGTKIGNVRAGNALDSILNIRGGDMDPTRFEWVGNMAGDPDVCVFWHTSGIRKLEDLRIREAVVGSTGKGGQNYSFPTAMNYVLGTKMKIILGYKGLGDRILAMERGEIDGGCGINASTLSLHETLISQGKLVPIVQAGGKPFTTLPDVPLTQSYARNDREKSILQTVFGLTEIGRTYALPPGTPKDRVALIREAFIKSTADPELIAAGAKLKLEIDPMSGEEVQAFIKRMAELTPEMKKEVLIALGE